MADPVTAGLMIGGSVLSAYGAHQEGKAQQRAKNIEARQMRRRGIQEEAISQQKAEEIRRQAGIMKSNAQASMAAMGGVTDDAGAIQAFADIEDVMNYNQLAALFEGDVKRQELEYGADAAKWEGKMAKRAGNIKAFSTLLGGASDVMGKKK